MPTSPRILVNEESDHDYQLLEAEIQRTHFKCELRRNRTRDGFLHALGEYAPDLIISDYHLANFTALDALATLKQRNQDTPLIVLTNALNEETAVECMKHGATDYVLKNRLPRLVALLHTTLERQRLLRENLHMHREYGQLIRLTPGLFCVASLDGALQVVNPAWNLRLGYTEHDLIDRPLFTLVHPDDRHALDHWWDNLISRGHHAAPFPAAPTTDDFECRLVHKDRGFRHILWSARPFSAEGKIYAYGHDITERKHAEAALRESEARFRRMADSAPVLIWLTDTTQSAIYFNQPWLDFTGRTLALETGTGWHASIHPDDRERCLQHYNESFTARTPFRIEYRLRRYDAQHRWVVSHGIPRYDEHGAFTGYIGSCFDVTDQHEIEAHLAYRAIKQAALASFGRYALARHTFAELAQEATRLVADTLRLDCSKLIAVDPADHTLTLTAATGPATTPLLPPLGTAPPAALAHSHALHLAEDPAHFPAASALATLGLRSGVAIPISNGKHTCAYLTALSREDRLFNREAVDFLHGIANILSTVHQREQAEAALEESEKKLLQSQKMEAVGLLAGGVAHDFNNLLTAIRCYADLLNDDLAELAPQLQPKASEILKATSRASVLVRQLLAFSRKQVLQPEFLDLNTIVTDLKDLIRSLLSENVELHVDLSPAPATIEADRSQIEQIIVNLAINARDAMPHGGRLTLSTGTRTLAEPDTAAADLSPGRYATLSVSDTGTGMTPEVQAKIFQPFFTTKPKGRGTGLGLATCAVILKNYHGAIRFETAPGHGTTFHVLLPGAEIPGLNLDFSFDETPGAGTETILLVEDDEAIRTVTTTILQNLGYHVHPMAVSTEAYEKFSHPAAPHYDMLLSDIVMPGMSGRELAERLRATRPTLRVLFMSGYVEDPEMLRAVQESTVPFLEKPFTSDTLAKKVRDTLDSQVLARG